MFGIIQTVTSCMGSPTVDGRTVCLRCGWRGPRGTKPLVWSQVPTNCAQLQTLIADFTLHIADGMLQKLPVFNGTDNDPPRRPLLPLRPLTSL
jgi:hypothetical protein